VPESWPEEGSGVLTRALMLAFAVALLAPGGAHAGVFRLDPPTITYTATAGEVDQIAAFETPTTIRFTRFGGAALNHESGCEEVGANKDTVDCGKAGVTSLVLDLGDRDDVAAISPALTLSVTFIAGSGADGLFGGGGLDTFVGGPGDDNIVSRDTRTELVDCGEGNDTAISDDGDNRISCEEVEGDADGDGVRRPTDCDDTKPGIRPGVTDIPENGVDEDCNAVDAVNSDRDGDASPRPQDCDDTVKSIRPGAKEVIGNSVDENCDGRIEPFPALTGSVAGAWSRAGNGTRNLRLIARGFPFRTVITLRCTGAPQCPRTTIRRVGRSRRAVNLHVILGRRALPKRARIDLQITRASRVGRVLRYRLGTPGLPDVEFLCRPPGGRSGPC
jgi:hypothetical protein